MGQTLKEAGSWCHRPPPQQWHVTVEVGGLLYSSNSFILQVQVNSPAEGCVEKLLWVSVCLGLCLRGFGGLKWSLVWRKVFKSLVLWDQHLHTNYGEKSSWTRRTSQYVRPWLRSSTDISSPQPDCVNSSLLPLMAQIIAATGLTVPLKSVEVQTRCLQDVTTDSTSIKDAVKQEGSMFWPIRTGI